MNMENKMAEKVLSAGFLVCYQGKYLACHASGRKYEDCSYDIPKGHVEDSETPLEAATRELMEEAGINLHDSGIQYHITDLGKQQYLKTKDLHVFKLDIIQIDKPFNLKCTSYFDVDGKQIPEVNGYEWTDNFALFYKSLQRIFSRLTADGKL